MRKWWNLLFGVSDGFSKLSREEKERLRILASKVYWADSLMVFGIIFIGIILVELTDWFFREKLGTDFWVRPFSYLLWVFLPYWGIRRFWIQPRMNALATQISGEGE